MLLRSRDIARLRRAQLVELLGTDRGETRPKMAERLLRLAEARIGIRNRIEELVELDRASERQRVGRYREERKEPA